MSRRLLPSCRPGAATWLRQVSRDAGVVPLSAAACAAGPALAEVSDAETLAGYRAGTRALLVVTAAAAMSGGRWALLLWPVALLWGMTALGTVWEWHEALGREGTVAPLWEGVLTGAAMLLAPPLFAGLSRRWRKNQARPGEPGTAPLGWARPTPTAPSPPPPPGGSPRCWARRPRARS